MYTQDISLSLKKKFKTEIGFKVRPVFVFPGPSGRPKFLTDKISTSSTSLSVVWEPPAAGTLNGEFLGYELTYARADAGSGRRRKARTMLIKEDILRVQVSRKNMF